LLTFLDSDYDTRRNFAADGPTPGNYLFSTGESGAVAKESAGAAAQVASYPAHWSVKFNRQKLALGDLTPEVGARHCLAAGGGWGGVGVQGGFDVSHLVTFGGLLDSDPGQTMTQLCETLDFRNPPIVVLHAIQAKP
jgi:hypothetical protein